MYLGSWYDRLHGDTPVSTNARLNYKPLAFFQSDMNMTKTLQSVEMEMYFNQVEQTQTDCFLYLTIYPMEGYDAVSDEAIADLSNRIKSITETGRKVLIRYASEMNGSWFRYGQQPTKFIKSWQKVVDAIRAKSGKENVAFLWSPNSGNGYPFPLGPFAIKVNTPDFDPLLDTNKDGVYDIRDDPYSPFYPGDDYVDWIGMSVYHYGKEYPWETNDPPIPGTVEKIISGQDPFGKFPFYRMFSGDGVGGAPRSVSKGGKPFMISESAATIHLSVTKVNQVTGEEYTVVPGRKDPESRAMIKQAWWRQMINATFLETFPKIKGMSLFEFIKYEENTWRDFTILGDTGTGIHSNYGNDGGPQDLVTLKTFQDDLKNGLGDLLLWSKTVNGSMANHKPSQANPNSKNDAVPTSSVGSVISLILAAFAFF
ncbi:hypothetical protein HDV02_006655 [Globomyces sp. JEL0801]|nr:hypothetical protein HDV02_006655 [Globomyces sp. JEL0801]